MNNIILFDGECNFCDSSVQFIIRRDVEGVFKFASLQSETGQRLLSKHHIPKDIDSFLLITNNKAYLKSAAALHVSRQLKGLWKLLYAFIVIPRPIRDFFYDILAKNRYKWFGKKQSCSLPSPEVRSRFYN